ncbi:MAG: hypothetical protein ACRDZT_00460, partial [Acidimicrobiales bacterium]
FGGAEHLKLAAPIVGMAVTPTGGGYWLVAADGGVFSYGNARFYGSLGGKIHTAAHDIVSIVATVDGKGYWLGDRSGALTPFGDAPHLPSLNPLDVSSGRPPIVGLAVLHDQMGAWVVNSAGTVFHLGQSHLYGGISSDLLTSPVVGIARTADGRGYWLSDEKGVVTSFGDAKAPVKPPVLPDPVVGITAAPNTEGYWAVSAGGYVIPGGVPSRGGLSHLSGGSLVTAIATAVPISTTPPPLPPLASGSVGYDVNWPQCRSNGSSSAGTLPGPPNYPAGSMRYGVAIVGVDGWAVDDYNSCLGAEVSWAKKTSVPGRTAPAYQLYLFLNAPASTSAADQSGPAGTCNRLVSSARPSCRAYNYGYNAGLGAVQYASSAGAHASIWWLDIENSSCAPGEYNRANNGEWWSCTQSWNARTVQGALDALRSKRIDAGIYSTATQWRAITGGYTPSGARVPLWIAGAWWTSPPYPKWYGYSGTSVLKSFCSGSYDFAGGKVMVLQETPGSNNYPFDPDYVC